MCLSLTSINMLLSRAGNVTSIARRLAPGDHNLRLHTTVLAASLTPTALCLTGAEVWLTESDSVCHQGVFGVTNAYLNSLWLVNRLGVLANHNVSVMARQSLVGYNYSLLGNWPVEVCAPPPQTL